MTDPMIPDNQKLAEHTPEKHSFPVVGLGASAGGLKALLQFFELMPASSGMAFVVILHLSPKHESHSADLLQNVTKMPVTQVNEPVRVEPDRVYVIPPTKHLQMLDGIITLKDLPPGRVPHVAVDLFFRTLADAHKDRAVCIVLSGTGSDGTVGLTRVKEQGGLAMAQSPDDAEYDGMPRNAIGTGIVDFVLPVVEMPNKLIELWQNASVIKLPPAEEQIRIIDPTLAAEEALRQILLTLRARTGHDFMHYKRATVLRRIERRLQVNQLPDLPAYQNFLREHQDETQALLRDMLISVTNFFRDREAFEALEREIIPRLFAGKTAQDQVRVWVAGCATGEEAYSIAMLLLEHAASLAQPPQLQIFATDIDNQLIAQAREGVYPESIITDIAPTRLRNFFTKEAGGYAIKKNVRERVLFAAHNVLRDPPFSRLDMVSCRNLMIYLNCEVQEQILQLFHFALQPGGYLFLGNSESADSVPNFFTALDKKHRLFKANVVARASRGMPLLPLGTPARTDGRAVNNAKERRQQSFGELHQRLLEQYAPPSVIINHDYDIVHLTDRAGRFLQFTGGEPSHSLLKVIHPELRLDLRTALFQAIQSRKSVEARRVRLNREGHTYYVNMIARPVQNESGDASYVLVIFDEVEDILGDDGRERQPNEPEPLVQQLEGELQRTKEQLQGTIEQYETSNEELRASNEELQAINEELRSTTEELETSKEEMQSINEELMTVNYELKGKVDEISIVNDDLKNLISATEIATIFIDRYLKVKRFTPRALDLFNLIPGDTGRSLFDITHRLDYPGLAADAEQVLDTLRPIEREVMDSQGRWYSARVLPYRTLDDRIDGVVLTFIDITERISAEEALRASRNFVQGIVSSIPLSLYIFDLRARQNVYLSPQIFETFGYTAEQMQASGTGMFEDFFHPADRPRLEAHFQRIEQARADEIFELEYRMKHANGSWVWVHSCDVVYQRDEQGLPTQLLGAAEDITARKRAEEALRESEIRFRATFEQANVGIMQLTSDGHFLAVNPGMCKIVGYTEAEMKSLTVRDITHPDDYPLEEAENQKMLAGEISGYTLEKRYVRQDGSIVWGTMTGTLVRRPTGEPFYMLAIIEDITTRKQAEATLRGSEERLRLLIESVKDYAIITMDTARRITGWNAGAETIFGYTAEEISGQLADLIFTLEDRAQGVPEQEVAQALATGHATDDRWHLRKDGTRLYVSGVVSALRDGKLSGFVKIARDLTARKQTEEELGERRKELEVAVQARTLELSQANELLQTEVGERRGAEERIKDLLRTIINTQEQERQRISRELHDHLGQLLTALRLNLESLKKRSDETRSTLGADITQAQTVAQQLDEGVDFLAWELRPTALEDLGLSAALGNYVAEWSKHFNIPAEFHGGTSSWLRLAPEVEINLYRIAQEALNNIAKHARANQVNVLLERRNNHLVLIIEDDGIGFDTEQQTPDRSGRGLGLVGMGERAALIGGTVEIESTPGSSTTVFVRALLCDFSQQGGGRSSGTPGETTLIDSTESRQKRNKNAR